MAAVLVVLPLMGVDLTVLSVFGGALGVGLGLGLQKIASNYLSGFIILLDRSIRLGDMITVDGHYGEVTRITTRYMVVRTLTGVEAIIPNDTLVTSTVLNHSYYRQAGAPCGARAGRLPRPTWPSVLRTPGGSGAQDTARARRPGADRACRCSWPTAAWTSNWDSGSRTRSGAVRPSVPTSAWRYCASSRPAGSKFPIRNGRLGCLGPVRTQIHIEIRAFPVESSATAPIYNYSKGED